MKLTNVNREQIAGKVEKPLDLKRHDQLIDNVRGYLLSRLRNNDTSSYIRGKIDAALNGDDFDQVSLGGSIHEKGEDPVLKNFIRPEIDAPNSYYDLSDPADLERLPRNFMTEIRNRFSEYYDELMEPIRNNQPYEDPRLPKGNPFADHILDDLTEMIDLDGYAPEQIGFSADELTDDFRQFLEEVANGDIQLYYYTALGSMLGKIMKFDYSIEMRQRLDKDSSKSNLMSWCTVNPTPPNWDPTGQISYADVAMEYDPSLFVNKNNPTSKNFEYFNTAESKGAVKQMARQLLREAYHHSKR